MIELALASIGIVTFIVVATRVYQWLNGVMVHRNDYYQGSRVAAGSSNPGVYAYQRPPIRLGNWTPGSTGGAGSPGRTVPQPDCSAAASWLSSAAQLRQEANEVAQDGYQFLGQGVDRFREAARLISFGTFAFQCQNIATGCNLGNCNSGNGANQLEQCSRDHVRRAEQLEAEAAAKEAQAAWLLAEAARLEAQLPSLRAARDAAWETYQREKQEADTICQARDVWCRASPTSFFCTFLTSACTTARAEEDAAYRAWQDADRAVRDAERTIQAYRLLAWDLINNPVTGARELRRQARLHREEAVRKHTDAVNKFNLAGTTAQEGRGLLDQAIFVGAQRRPVLIYQDLIFAEALERNARVTCSQVESTP